MLDSDISSVTITNARLAELTKWPQAGIRQPGKRDLEFHARAVGIAGPDNGATDVGGIAVGERCDVRHTGGVALDDCCVAEETSDAGNGDWGLSASDGEARGQGEEDR